MKPSQLSVTKIIHKGSGNTTKRVSYDFLINGKSLLDMLAGANSDQMGCFVEGLQDNNEKSKQLLLMERESNLESKRIELYICPECGDIGCGSFTARVEKIKDQYVWSDFAYENGYEEPEPIEFIEEYYFNSNEYKECIEHASSI